MKGTKSNRKNIENLFVSALREGNTLVFIFLVSLLLTSQRTFADDYYRRHYLILVDQTKDVIIDDSVACKDVFLYLRNNFLRDKSDFDFDSITDEVSLYTFALPGGYDLNERGFVGIYKKIHTCALNNDVYDAYDLFVKNLIQRNGRYSDAKNNGMYLTTFVDSFLFPLFKGESQHFSEIMRLEPPIAVTFSKYIYPVILEKEFFDFSTPASEYIIIIVSNFQSGLDDLGTSEDRNTLIKMLGEKNKNSKPNLEYFEERFNTLAGPFYQIPIIREEFYNSTSKKNAQIIVLGYKLGLQSLQGVSTFITSNIDIHQTEFGSVKYQIGPTSVSFNHDENLVIDSVKLRVFDSNLGKELFGCIIPKDSDNNIKGSINDGFYQRSEETRSYDFGSKVIDLFNRSVGDTLLFKYIFYSTINNGNQAIMPMVFEADRNVVLTESVFCPKITIFEKIAYIIIILSIVVLFILARVIYNKRGKSFLQGVHVKIWHVSNSRFMELQDYQVVDEDCWYMRRGERQRLINITGSVERREMVFARQYHLKVEFRIDEGDNNVDFGFRPDGMEDNGKYRIKSKWYEVPLNSDGTFEFNALAYQVEGKSPDLNNRNNILVMIVEVKASLYKGKDVISSKEDIQRYQFIVRPEISNAALWMAFDPGTSGACVAYGFSGNPTEKTNIKIAYNTEVDSTGQETQVSIFPSKIKIPDNSSIIMENGNVEISKLKEAFAYGAEGDFYFGNLARVYEGRNSFQSIKKLLGYKDMQVIVDENREEVCKLPGRDLALLLVKGLCNHFEQYIRTNPEVSDKERNLFIHNGKFEPSRAIVAIPNNYTIVKAQDMVNSIKRTGLFKEVHYLYEAEGVMMCYLREKWDDITNNPWSYEEEGKFFVVFDMGGATINTTAFSVKIITARNNDSQYIREIELSTESRIGYNVGGDEIDYSWIRILYQIPAVKKFLKEININWEEHIKQHRTGLLKFVQRLKLDWMDKLSISDALKDDEINRFWMDISADNGFPDIGIQLSTQIDSESSDYIRKEWRTRSVMNKYVFSAVKNAISELLSIIQAKNIEIVFSGRTSLYPGIKQTVISTIENELKLNCSVWDGFERMDTGKSVDEVVKTAVATGACWYAMFSNFIKLKHNIVTSTYGYVDLKNGKSTFIPLIIRGAKLDESGKLQSDPKQRVLTPNLPNVRILQMLTSNYEMVMEGLRSANILDNDRVKHLVNQLVDLNNDEIDGEIKGVVINVDDKNNFSYQVNIAGGEPLIGSGNVNDADIKTENSDAYAFSAMPCTEDETTDVGIATILKPQFSNENSLVNETEIKQVDNTMSKGKNHF